MKAIKAVVRADLQTLEAGDLVLVACSGGADSVALALATLEVAPEFAIRVGVLSVDHQLQPGSAIRAADVVERMRNHGADPAEVITVEVGVAGGVEAAARAARYEALDQAREKYNARAIYLGHTASDQAETVLLGLVRGSGARSLAAMAARIGFYHRPLLRLSREEIRSELNASEFWDDPHNEDPRFTRVRVRHQVLPLMEKELGPGIESALVRTAKLLRDDADALDSIAQEAYLKAVIDDEISISELMNHPRAIRTRVIKEFIHAHGLPAPSAEHIDAVESLASQWKGQGPVALPGNIDATREGGVIRLRLRP